MAEFKAINTQEEFDAAISERLKREKATIEKEYAWAAEAKEKAEKYDALMQTDPEGTIKGLNEELAKAKEAIAGHDKTVSELTARATKAEGELTKNKIAHAHGVPLELANRLNGSTEEELTKDAELFASFLAPKTAPPARSTEPNVADANVAAMMETLQQLNLQ